MYKLVEYSDVYSKTSWSLWQVYRDEPAPDFNKNIIDFPADNNNSILFKYKLQIKGQTENSGAKNDVEIIVTLKYLSNIWKTLEMPLNNFEINLQLKWFKKCILVAGTTENQLPDLKITVTKLYVTVAALSTQENVKLVKQLEFSFKTQIYWNRY